MRELRLLFLATLVAFSATATAKAAVLFHEPFDYTVDAWVHSESDWTSTYGLKSLADSMTAPDGYGYTPTGNRAGMRSTDTGNGNIKYDFAAHTPGAQIDLDADQTRYVSFLARREHNGWFNSMLLSPSGTEFDCGLDTNSGKKRFAGYWGKGRFSYGSAANDDTFLFVLKVDSRVTTGSTQSFDDDIISMKTYKVGADTVGYEPAAWDYEHREDNSRILSQLQFNGSKGDGTDNGFVVDEVRVGETWEDVTGVPDERIMLADARADFSTVQGEDNWHYGYWTIDDAYDHTTEFSQLIAASGWGEDAWMRDGNKGPVIAKEWVRPDGMEPDPTYATVRRWESEVTDSITVEWGASRSNPGATARGEQNLTVYHNGVEVDAEHWDGVSGDGSGRGGMVTLDVNIGDKIDFILDPAGDAGYCGLWFDSVVYTVIPEPGTLGMLVSGLVSLALFAWRRRRAA